MACSVTQGAGVGAVHRPKGLTESVLLVALTSMSFRNEL